VNYDTAEYRRSNGAMSSGAITAWQSGSTGQGIKVAVIDSGINPALAEFAGRIDSASTDVAGSRALGDEDGHGTAVAATIGAARNSLENVGVAFNSTIVALRADEPGSCASTDGCNFYDDAIARGVDAARNAGAKVINMSLGGDPPSTQLLNAIGRAVNAGIVVVISAGNDGRDPTKGTNADPFALGAAQTYPGKVIIAGALDGSLSQLADFSNRAGAGQAWYLTALGAGVRTIDNTGTGYLYSGTSFSAPIISGAAALLAQEFPNLSGQQIIDLLFRTADDLGATGDDSVYGQGRLNIARAFQPVGTTALAGTGTAVTALSTSGALPEAAGDSVTTASTGLGAIILDGYSRAFSINLAAGLRGANQRQPLQRALSGHVRTTGASAGPIAVTLSIADNGGTPVASLAETGIGPRDAAQSRLVAGQILARIDSKTRLALGISDSAKSLERKLSGASGGGFLIARDTSGEPGFSARRGESAALRREFGGRTGLTFSMEEGEVDRPSDFSQRALPYRMGTISVDRAVGRNGWASFGMTRLDEQRSLLGGELGSSFGGGGSASWFADAEYRHDLGSDVTATLAARRGWTAFSGGQFTSGAYSFDLARTGLFGEADRLGFRLSQPLRIDGGGLAMMLPTGYDYATGVTSFGMSRLSLTPTGREIDAELGYSTMIGAGSLGTNLFVRRQPGHVAAADADVGAAVRYSVAF
jgi:hypothetical protein